MQSSSVIISVHVVRSVSAFKLVFWRKTKIPPHLERVAKQRRFSVRKNVTTT